MWMRCGLAAAIWEYKGARNPDSCKKRLESRFSKQIVSDNESKSFYGLIC
jgi:hypothetical protein